MNVLNRLVIVILLVAIMVFGTILLVAPVPILDWANAWLAYAIRYFEMSEPYSAAWIWQKALGILFAVVLDVILLLLIIAEVRRPRRKAIRVEKSSGGDVMISIPSIADQLKYEIDQLAGVLRVRPKVSGKRRGVVVKLDVQTAAGIDVPERAERIVETARVVVEEKMGLRLARPPKVSLRAVPHPRTPIVHSAPTKAPPILPDQDLSPDLVKDEPPAILPDQDLTPALVTDETAPILPDNVLADDSEDLAT
jgi:hypothetical protein